MYTIFKLICILLTSIHNGYSTTLILVGGGLSDNNVAIWEAVVDAAGGSGNARIGVITAASGDPIDSADYYETMFTSYGATEVYFIPVYEGNEIENSNPDVVSNIRRMTGFFFGGGDQRRILNSFYNNGRIESPALIAMRETYIAGAVAGGTSAGAAVMGTPVMISGGMSWDALRYGAYEDGNEIGRDDLTYIRDGGIGFLDNYVVDTHFSERGREGRLVTLLWDTRQQSNGAQWGIGVDEDTALVIESVESPSARGTVIGKQGVFFGDISESRSGTSDGYFYLDNIYTHYLTEGDSINMNTHSVTFAAYKSNMKGQEYYDTAATSERIFNGNRANPDILPEYTYVATDLFDARLSTTTFGLTTESSPRYKVDFVEGSRAVGYGGRHPDTDRFTISYKDLLVDMGPQ